MKVNDITLTKHNLGEMVKDWEHELGIAMADVRNDTHPEALHRLSMLRSRMLNIVNNCKPL